MSNKTKEKHVEKQKEHRKEDIEVTCWGRLPKKKKMK